MYDLFQQDLKSLIHSVCSENIMRMANISTYAPIYIMNGCHGNKENAH